MHSSISVRLLPEFAPLREAIWNVEYKLKTIYDLDLECTLAFLDVPIAAFWLLRWFKPIYSLHVWILWEFSIGFRKWKSELDWYKLGMYGFGVPTTEYQILNAAIEKSKKFDMLGRSSMFFTLLSKFWLEFSD
jgi:hypothetical protein